MVASAGHRYAEPDLDDPGFKHTPYDPMVAYGRSKTANIQFAVEFDRRHRTRDVRATALHPGGIQTELGRHVGQGAVAQSVERINADLAAAGKPAFAWKTIPEGAATRFGRPSWRRRRQSAAAIARTATCPGSPTG